MPAVALGLREERGDGKRQCAGWPSLIGEIHATELRADSAPRPSSWEASRVSRLPEANIGRQIAGCLLSGYLPASFLSAAGQRWQLLNTFAPRCPECPRMKSVCLVRALKPVDYRSCGSLHCRSRRQS